jgi:phosphoglycerate kinase
MGLFEVPEFSQGTQAIAKAFARHVKDKPYGLVGGGETIAVINQLGLHKDIDFISTGGGAMLAFIENGTLPALEKLVR